MKLLQYSFEGLLLFHSVPSPFLFMVRSQTYVNLTEAAAQVVQHRPEGPFEPRPPCISAFCFNADGTVKRHKYAIAFLVG